MTFLNLPQSSLLSSISTHYILFHFHIQFYDPCFFYRGGGTPPDENPLKTFRAYLLRIVPISSCIVPNFILQCGRGDVFPLIRKQRVASRKIHRWKHPKSRNDYILEHNHYFHYRFHFSYVPNTITWILALENVSNIFQKTAIINYW